MEQIVSLDKDKVDAYEPELLLESAATLSVELVIKRGTFKVFDQELRATAKIPLDLPASGTNFGPHLEAALRRAMASMKIEAVQPPAIRSRRSRVQKKS